MKLELSIKPGTILTPEGHFYTHTEFFNAVNNGRYDSMLEKGLAYLTLRPRYRGDNDKVIRYADTNLMDIVTRIYDVDPEGQFIDIDGVHLWCAKHSIYSDIKKGKYKVLPRIFATYNSTSYQVKIIRLLGFDLCEADDTLGMTSVILRERD